MTSVRPPAPPKGLQKRGRAFWRKVFDAELDPTDAELELLLELCRALDEAEALHAVIATDGPMSTGSKGQPVAHPAAVELRQCRQVISRLMAQLQFPADDDGPAAPSAASLRGRRAARSRWAAHNATRGGADA